MKAITLTQPWATLVAEGVKRIETRSWSTSYRGPIAIHAAKGWTASDRAFTLELVRRGLLRDHTDFLAYPPRGSVVAVANLVDVFRTEHCDDAAPSWWYRPAAIPTRLFIPPREREVGDFAPGRFAWLLADVEALEQPRPARGALGLWEWPDAYVFTLGAPQ